MRKLNHFIIILALSLCTMNAQDTLWSKEPEFSLLTATDIFYTYDIHQPKSITRQPFLYNYNRHNEFNLNLGLIKLTISHPKYRSNLAFQTGTYAEDNYALETDVAKHIFEANIGISLNEKNNLWLDAGIMPSHIGFESAISSYNMTLSQSLMSENSPYYSSGVKLTYKPNDRWEIASIICNGWQRIQKVVGNSLPSLGTQILYKPNKRLTFNWSTFIGTDSPDSTRTMRYFNDLFAEIEFTKHFKLSAGFDMGAQQKHKNSSNYSLWTTSSIVGQFVLNGKWKTAWRAESFYDKDGVIIAMGEKQNFKTIGFSWNFDYTPNPYIMIRMESRWLRDENRIFENNSSKDNVFVSTSIAVTLDQILSDR